MKRDIVDSIEMEKPDEFYDLMTIQEWIDSVLCGGFIDYDGFGYLCTEDLRSNLRVKPSYVQLSKIKYVSIDFDPGQKIEQDIVEQFTHIDWCNR